MSKGSYIRPGDAGIDDQDIETMPATDTDLSVGDAPQRLPDSPRRDVMVAKRPKPFPVSQAKPVIDPVEAHAGSVLRDFIRREVRLAKSRRKRTK